MFLFRTYDQIQQQLSIDRMMHKTSTLKYLKLNYLLTKGTSNHEQLIKEISNLKETQPSLHPHLNNHTYHHLQQKDHDDNNNKKTTFRHNLQIQSNQLLHLTELQIFKEVKKVLAEISQLQTELMLEHKLVQIQANQLKEYSSLHTKQEHKPSSFIFLHEEMEKVRLDNEEIGGMIEYLSMEEQELHHNLSKERSKREQLSENHEMYKAKLYCEETPHQNQSPQQKILKNIQQLTTKISKEIHLITSISIPTNILQQYASQRIKLQSSIDNDQQQKLLFYQDLLSFKNKYKMTKQKNSKLKLEVRQKQLRSPSSS